MLCCLVNEKIDELRLLKSRKRLGLRDLYYYFFLVQRVAGDLILKFSFCIFFWFVVMGFVY